MAVGPQESVLYPLGSRVLAGVAVAICAVIEASLLVYGHAELTIRATPAVLLAAVLVFVLFWMPRVELDPGELRVINPFRSYRISWPAIREIDSRWSLTLHTVRGRVTAWAAPSPGLLSQAGRMRRGAFSIWLGTQRESRGAEQARQLIVRQWEAYRDQGVLGAVEGEGVTRRWNMPAVVVVVVLTAAAIAGAAWP
jgi:Bacterial PH domain